jgi:hypothetical protein
MNFSFNNYNINDKFSQEDLLFIKEYDLGSESFDYLKLLKQMFKEKEDINLVNNIKSFSLDYKSLLLPLKNIFIKNPKTDKNTHKKRNINQYNLAPETLDQINILVELDLFYKLSHTASHNLLKEDNTEDGRWKWSLVLERNNKNVDYRGKIDTIFEGTQLIYNEDTKSIVTGDLNKGTWDYRSPLKTILGHFQYDIVPWIMWGNMGDDPKNKILIDNDIWKLIEKQYNNYIKRSINKEEARQNVQIIINDKVFNNNRKII